MLKSIHAFMCKHAGFTIIGHGYAKKHYAMRTSEALAWAACYDHAHIYTNGIWAATIKKH